MWIFWRSEIPENNYIPQRLEIPMLIAGWRNVGDKLERTNLWSGLTSIHTLSYGGYYVMCAWTLPLSWLGLTTLGGVDVYNDFTLTHESSTISTECHHLNSESRLLVLSKWRYSQNGGRDRGRNPTKRLCSFVIPELTSSSFENEQCHQSYKILFRPICLWLSDGS